MRFQEFVNKIIIIIFIVIIIIIIIVIISAPACMPRKDRVCNRADRLLPMSTTSVGPASSNKW